MRREYRRRSAQFVIAVQLNLDTEGFTFRKWGDTQRCKSGDWIVNNDGETYTVERDTFARTYREVGPGQYRKVTNVWAEEASAPGSVKTQEGRTHYEAGDYIIFDTEDGPGRYAVSAAKFEQMYEPVS